jgi:2-dehydropantoate 2-reductase
VAVIAVLGPGGVGGFVAAALWRAGEDVIVVARAPTAEQIERDGIEIERSAALHGGFTARPAAVTELTAPVDVLLVATKAGGLDGGLERIAAEPGLVVPLLNGLEHMAALRARFGEQRVCAGVIRIESDRVAPGRIVQRSPAARVDIADGAGQAIGARVASLAAALTRAGLDVRTGGAERQVLWSKLARLNALSLTTSASGRPLGFVREDPRWRSALEGAVNETIAVAAADGATLNAADTLAELEAAHPELTSSMARDIEAGREPELDALAGAVLRAADAHGVRCPTVRWLAAQVAGRAGLDPAAYRGGRTGSPGAE